MPVVVFNLSCSSFWCGSVRCSCIVGFGGLLFSRAGLGMVIVVCY